MTIELVKTSTRVSKVLSIAQEFTAGERLVLAKLLLDSLVADEIEDDTDRQAMSLTAFEKDWDNPDDALLEYNRDEALRSLDDDEVHRMPPSRLSSEEIKRRGETLYSQTIRAQVEKEDNIGKLVSIDIETGNYEIGDDRSLDAPRRLRAKQPGSTVYTRRIGYNAVYALGGVVERTDL